MKNQIKKGQLFQKKRHENSKYSPLLNVQRMDEDNNNLLNGLSRRQFLTLMGASMALAGMVSCRRPVEKIVPYVQPPEEVMPGIPLYYATTMPFANESQGIVVKTHEGRPIKIEGHPEHPANLGSTNVFMQAEILSLYDPDRSGKVLHNGVEKKWEDFIIFWRNLYTRYRSNNGQGLAVLSRAVSSPSFHRIKSVFAKTFPAARWVTYDPVSDENILNGIRTAAGQRLIPIHDIRNASVIVALDADLLHNESNAIPNAFGFAQGRRLSSPYDDMNRLYVVEPSFTATGAAADHRLPMACSDIPAFALALAQEIRDLGVSIDWLPEVPNNPENKINKNWLYALAKDLLANRGKNAIIAGRRQPVHVHALLYALNESLGNNGKTVHYRSLQDELFSDVSELVTLADLMQEGRVDTLVILCGNPMYDAPVDLSFQERLKNVNNTIHLSLYNDETSRQCLWHLPETHFLEQWGDARTLNGAISFIQPMIMPLHDGRSSLEILNLLATDRDSYGYDLVRQTWQLHFSNTSFEADWRRALHDGVLKDSAGKAVRVGSQSNELKKLFAHDDNAHVPADEPAYEIIFQTSNSMFDGRYANNGWLQELPDPISKLAWDNAAYISNKCAEDLRLENEDVIKIESSGCSLEIPVWIMPGQADKSITLSLGYGRTAGGKIGTNLGFNTYVLRTSKTMGCARIPVPVKLGRVYKLANAQEYPEMQGRPLVREANLEVYREAPHFAQKMVEHPALKSLWREHSYDRGYQWGMAIDLTACIGCNACTIACQSENNIPIVGKEQVAKGREMHWIRLDRYFNGDAENTGIVYQPVACHHCENAPCEQVCPVAATVHDEEGLNVMVYNRCVGTRYCSNNCPYKARRFNFFDYTGAMPELIKMAQNPNVTVRARGIMEKCTYCLQRLTQAKLRAKREDREIFDQVRTACEQACPTKAITFGNINDPSSRIFKIKKLDRNYEMLAELNVQPRTSYLAKIRNPNPALS